MIRAVAVAVGSAGWQRAASLPLARSEVAAAPYGSGIVVVGGAVAGGSANTARADLYLPARNRWRRLPNYPLAIDHAAAAGAGRRAYVVGGFGPRGGAVRVGYALENGRCRRLPRLPAPRGAAGAAIMGGKLYVVGGLVGARPAQAALILDLRSGRWSPAPGPTPRHHLGVAAVGGRIYAVGGETEPGRELALVESWAPGERSSSRGAPTCAARSRLCSGSCPGRRTGRLCRRCAPAATASGSSPSETVSTRSEAASTPSPSRRRTNTCRSPDGTASCRPV